MSKKRIQIGVLIIIVVILAVVGWSVFNIPNSFVRLSYLNLERNLNTSGYATPGERPAAPLSPSASRTTPTKLASTGLATPLSINNNGNLDMIVLAMMDGNLSHIFLYNPENLPLRRLTNNPWDDMHPAVSPDGARLAFTSRKTGYWDIWIMDLSTGMTTPLTQTREYDGTPTWSPDGQWLAYESYLDDNLEILIKSPENPNQPAVRLTESPGLDYDPFWSPLGREIAFVSNRTGSEEVWIARLDQVDNRFTNISRNPETKNVHPAYSSDGRFLSWTAIRDGYPSLVVTDRQKNIVLNGFIPMTSSSQTIWKPGNDAILTKMETITHTYLAAILPNQGLLKFPYLKMPGTIHGMTWISGKAAELIAKTPPPNGALDTPPQLYETTLSQKPLPPSGRFGIVSIKDVNTPFPFLSDTADESFLKLREIVGKSAGWDVLSSLENAFLPITEPGLPGYSENWLLTGRAIALNTLPVNARWMVNAREIHDGQTYWRLFIRTRLQDGSQGMPIKIPVWNFEARYQGNIHYFEQGGKYESPPSGYWMDFTELAQRYGWERLPALSTWRGFYPAAQYNIFIFREGLDWQSAMGEIYPPEAAAGSLSKGILTKPGIQNTQPDPTATPTPLLPTQ